MTLDLDRVSIEVVTAVLQRHFPDGAPKKVQLLLREKDVDIEGLFKVRSEFGSYQFMLIVDKMRGEAYIIRKLLAMIRYGMLNLRNEDIKDGEQQEVEGDEAD